MTMAALCFAHPVTALAQTENVGIGTANPDPSSLLDLVSSNKGLLIPRLTLAQRDAIVQPAKGLIIFNLTANEFEYNSGTPAIPIWTRLIGVSGGNQGNDFWSTTGNIVDPTVNFLGSRNAAPLIFRTDNVTRLTIAPDGVLTTQREIRISTGGLFLEGASSPLIANGSAGVAGNVLVSAGPGATPLYTDSLALRGISVTNATIGTLRATTIVGPLTFNGPTTFTDLPDMPLASGHLLVGNNANRAFPMAPGSEGFVLGVVDGRPTWVNPVTTISQTAWVLGGNVGPSSSILGNTSTTGMMDLDVRAGNRSLLFLGGAAGTIDVRGPINLSGATTPLTLNGNAGVAGNVLVSNGPGATPQYTDTLALRGISATNASIGTLRVTNVAGDVTFSGQTTFTQLPDMPLAPGHLLVGNNAGRAAQMAPGNEGYVMGIVAGRPAWVDPVSTINQTAWTVGGNPNPASTILGNTSTTGIVDLDIRAGNATLLHLDGTAGSIDVRGPLNLSGTTTPILLNGNPGQAGNVLVSAGPGNTPQWSPINQLPVWRLGGNSGTTVSDVLGTTDAQDLRLATNGTVRVTVAQGTGAVSIASLAGPAQAQPSGSSEAVVVADANGTLHKRGKDALFSLFGIASGRYVNATANAQFVVVITLPAGATLDAQASITLTPEASASVGITPFIVNGSRTATSFTINFPGGLNPGEAINWMVMNP